MTDVVKSDALSIQHLDGERKFFTDDHEGLTEDDRARLWGINSPIAAAMLLVAEPGAVYSPSDFPGVFNRKLGTEGLDLPKISPALLGNTLRSKLGRPDMFERYDFPGSPNGFMITPSGSHIGAPMAANLLVLSATSGFKLHEALPTPKYTPANNGEALGQLNRVAILRALLEQDDAETFGQLEERLEAAGWQSQISALQRQLYSMRDSKIIDVVDAPNSRHLRMTYPVYKVPGGFEAQQITGDKRHGKEGALAIGVGPWLETEFANEEFTAQTIYDRFADEINASLTTSTKVKDAKRVISGTLDAYSEAGLLDLVEPGVQGINKCRLSEKGVVLARGVVELDNLIQNDPAGMIQTGRAIREQLLSDPGSRLFLPGLFIAERRARNKINRP